MSPVPMIAPDGEKVRWEAAGTRALTAASVAVVVYAIAAATGWLGSGSHLTGIAPLALGAVVVFAVTAAIRGVNAFILRKRPGALPAVVADVGMCAVALTFVAFVGSLNDSAGAALYSVSIMAAFLLPSVAVVSSIAEVVIRSRWLSTVAVVLAGLVGTGVLGVYAAVTTWTP